MNQITREYDELARIIEAREKEIEELKERLEWHKKYSFTENEAEELGSAINDVGCSEEGLISKLAVKTIYHLRDKVAELEEQLSRYRVPCEGCGGTGLADTAPDFGGDKHAITHCYCPACLGLGYTEIVRVPDWFVKRILQLAFRLEGNNLIYTTHGHPYDGDNIIFAKLTRDPNDPDSWILTEAKE